LEELVVDMIWNETKQRWNAVEVPKPETVVWDVAKYKTSVEELRAVPVGRMRYYAVKYDAMSNEVRTELRLSFWEDQDGLCLICYEPIPPDEVQNGKKTHLDHNHETGLVRGLLHALCNTSLGHVERFFVRGEMDNVMQYLGVSV
jgi:hypothetical protein